MILYFFKPTNWNQKVKPVIHSLLSLSCCLVVGLGGLVISSESHGVTCPTLFIGDEVVVQNVGKQGEERSGLNVRVDPDINADNTSPSMPLVFDDTKGIIVTKFEGANYIWYEVEWSEPIEIQGWSVGIYGSDKVIAKVSEASEKDTLVEILFDLKPGEADTKTKHDYNDYKCYPIGFSDDTPGYNGGHTGWDVRTTPETDSNRDAYFYSLTAGEVIRAKDMFIDESGAKVFRANPPNIIAIYDDGMTTLYLHAREVDVSVGQRVNVGTRLGKQGEEGFATGPHVHIEVREGRTIFASLGPETVSNPNIPPIPYLYEKYEADSIAVGGGGQPSSPDVNDDGQVDILDLLMVWKNIGKGDAQFDVNGDGIVNNADIVAVAENLDDQEGAAAPGLSNYNQIGNITLHEGQVYLGDMTVSQETVQQLLYIVREANNGKYSIAILESILALMAPNKTILLANYPNPFNPETWIPYQLAKSADVTLTIYDLQGKLIRQLALGHQPAGIYQSRNRSAYWDGRNAHGELVASGVYFYTLTAGDFTATRKMLIRK